MPSHQQPRITNAEAVPYLSASCRVGTHYVCAESSPAMAPIDVPVIYEVCDCPCHSAFNRSASAEVKR